jgi:hypothetical protein
MDGVADILDGRVAAHDQRLREVGVFSFPL